MPEERPLLATRGVARTGAWEANVGSYARTRVVAATVGCIAVLALLGMETRGLMHFGENPEILLRVPCHTSTDDRMCTLLFMVLSARSCFEPLAV